MWTVAQSGVWRPGRPVDRFDSVVLIAAVVVGPSGVFHQTKLTGFDRGEKDSRHIIDSFDSHNGAVKAFSATDKTSVPLQVIGTTF